MPHPDSLVEFEVSEDLAASPRDTMQDVVLLGGYTASDTAPDQPYNELSTYSDAESVGLNLNEGSDIHQAAKQYFRTGAQSVRALPFEFDNYTETFSATDTFTLENAPVTGLEPASATIDGTDAAIIYVVESPPDVSTATDLQVDSGSSYEVQTGQTVNYSTADFDGTGDIDGTLETSEAVVLNADTGEGVATTSGEIEIDYYSVPWNDVFLALEGRSINFIDLANHLYGYESLGDIDELVPWQDSNQVARIQAYKPGQHFGRPEEGVTVAQEIGNYAPSGATLPIAHETTNNDALAAYGLGLYATNDVGYNIFQAEYPVTIPTLSRYARLVGDPETSGTFEGGDDGSGPSNVLVDDQGTVRISNSLTTAGISADRRYLDRTRRIWDVRNRARQTIKERLQDGGRFDRTTQVTIEEAIEDEFSGDVGDGEMYQNLQYEVPDPDETARSDRANRIWEDTTLYVELNEPVHRVTGTIEVSL